MMEGNVHNRDLMDQWTCHVCGLRLSRKQRLQGHIRSKHPNIYLPDHLQNQRGMYRIYDLDESVPVPKRTKYRQHQTADRLDNQEDIIPAEQTQEQFQPNDYPSNQASADKTCNSNEEKCMAVLSYISKMRLTGTASEQLIRLLNIFGNTELSTLQIKQNLNGIVTKTFDYCELCACLFPDDKDNYLCAFPGCNGLRYSGLVESQHLKRPKLQFSASSIQSQIADIIRRKPSLKSGAISLTMNTDGVPLYKASSVSLWPVFLVINELPPSERFQMPNVIVWGIWQGRGKPMFRSFLKPLTTELNSLYSDGLQFQEETVKVSLSCVTMDLQAKAQVMEMVAHNGQCSCVTCECIGEVTKKGKGYTKCFPVADPCPQRTSASIMKNAEDAMLGGSHHVKGVKNVSVLFDVDHFDPVDGVVPDYMHGVLLGTTKKLLNLWFGKPSAGQPFYIGSRVKDVDTRLLKMKPTSNMSRLPRSIDQHLSHWKASELQHWLLFYSVPCLNGILPQPFIENLCYLIEGVYILLSDSVTNEDIDKAELSLTKFQITFETLYGKNNCGLNVHNIGCHLAHYARLHGPLWGWSCFAFEDMNGILLKSAHGTGNVCRQLLEALLVQKKLHNEADAIEDEELRDFTLDMLTAGKRTKTKKECLDCKLIGKSNVLDDKNLENSVKSITGEGKCLLFEYKRIRLNNQLITSKNYKRMQKRNCHTSLMANGTIQSIEFFIHDAISDKCFAKAQQLNVSGFVNENVSHLINVKASGSSGLVPVNEIVEKVIFLNGNESFDCVARLPTIYNHCV